MTVTPYSLRVGLLAALATAGLASGAFAHEYQAGPLKIGHPWTRATPGGATVAAGYLSVTNTGSEPDKLVGGSLDKAGPAEVHEMKMEGGVMKMNPVPGGGLEIEPGQTVTLKPGSYHLMFTHLMGSLKKGEMAKGTLRFEKAGTVPVGFLVEGIAAKAPSEGHGAMKGM